jgi:DNA-binding CsgD family transcriptional regulator
MDYFRVDPTVKHAFSSILPIVWDKLENNERQHPVFREAHDFGIEHGISLPLHSPSAPSGLVSICRHPNAPSITADEICELFWFVTHIHARVISLTQSSKEKVTLTPRENEAIRLVQRGMTAKTVAVAMGVKKRTVEKHVENAMAKLGAQNRVQMISLARDLGLIGPHEC